MARNVLRKPSVVGFTEAAGNWLITAPHRAALYANDKITALFIRSSCINTAVVRRKVEPTLSRVQLHAYILFYVMKTFHAVVFFQGSDFQLSNRQINNPMDNIR